MQPEELLFKEAVEAVKQKNIPLARDLLTRLLQRNRSNAQYWVLMSAVVKTVKEREFCLREAHKLDPGNPTAIHGLRLMGHNIEDPAPVQAFPPDRPRWKTSLELATEQETLKARPRRKSSSWAVLGLILIGLSAGVFYLLRGPRYQPDTSPILKFSLTPPPTATREVTPRPTDAGPVPLWMLLEATYTSTPIYAATPHKLTEAYQVAMRYYEQQNWPQALQFFEQVLYSEPASPDIQYHIGEIYRFQGLASEAAQAYDASIKISPIYAPAYVGRGRVYLMGSRPQPNRARDYFELAIELDPMQYEAYEELASLELDDGDAAAALAYLEQIPAEAPETVLRELTRAEAYLMEGESVAALEAAEAANRIDITSLPVYLVIARAYQANGKIEDSIEPLETYLTWVDGDPEALGLMASALVEQGEYADALDYAMRALDLDEGSITALLARAEIYLDDGQVDEAAEDFNNVLRLDRNSFAATLGISRIQSIRELFGSAYEFAQSAYDMAQGDRQLASALFWRAQALIGLNELRAAARDLEALLALPQEELPVDLRVDALTMYRQVITPTPSLTPVPTSTPTITLTPVPTRTPSLTPTPVPTKNLPPPVTATPRN